MNNAKVSLDILPASGLDPTLTQWGVARNFPAVAISRASPVWNAKQSTGIETFVKSPPRVRIYNPDAGEGEGMTFGSESTPS
jgi:hypothetical protein